jgi:FemAB-related protein (PEP-CTERM system-associated)
MTAPFALGVETVRAVELGLDEDTFRLEGFVADHGGSLFHRPAWLRAIERGTGQRARGLVAERGGVITGWLPLTEVHSPLFGRMLASSGFAVGGGPLAPRPSTVATLCRAAEEWATRLSCTAIELRGGAAPTGWQVRSDSHAGFVRELAADRDAQLATIPRKQRAEVRKSLEADFEIHIGRGPAERAEHYAVYAESVRNLGTPVFPRNLFESALDHLDGDILTVRHRGLAIASVLSFYHGGEVMPYWGGGTRAARTLRANERMYFELMLHARAHGCERFDFGRSKAGSGAWHYKKNWGFEPQALVYATWNAPGSAPRDADPTSARHASRIALWRQLPLALANRIGPPIARGLG